MGRMLITFGGLLLFAAGIGVGAILALIWKSFYEKEGRPTNV